MGFPQEGYVAEVLPIGGWTVVMCGWGRPEAGVLCVV